MHFCCVGDKRLDIKSKSNDISNVKQLKIKNLIKFRVLPHTFMRGGLSGVRDLTNEPQ